jgi:hypothetical protein
MKRLLVVEDSDLGRDLLGQIFTRLARTRNCTKCQKIDSSPLSLPLRQSWMDFGAEL